MLYNDGMRIEFKNFFGKKGLPDIDCELNENDCAIAFGLSLRRLRKFKGLTLDKLSEEIEITNPTLNRYESGYNLPSIFMALKIANYFDTTIESMIYAGITEMFDKENGTYKEENKYAELFVGLKEIANNILKNKNTIKFQDHKKKRR